MSRPKTAQREALIVTGLCGWQMHTFDFTHILPFTSFVCTIHIYDLFIVIFYLYGSCIGLLSETLNSVHLI